MSRHLARHLARLAAAALVAAAASLATPVAPAALAAGCSSASGVTVVVDFHELGGGVQSTCDATGGGRTAAKIFTESGFSLTYVARQPGFVCRVDGKPASDPCQSTPPADAYWGLWWSNGTSGKWAYSSQGAGSLTVPAGGSVAFSWNGSSTAAKPRFTPPTHASSSPSPSASPTKQTSPSSSPSPHHATQPAGPSSQPSSQSTSPGAVSPPPAGDSPTTASATGASSAAPTKAGSHRHARDPHSAKPGPRTRKASARASTTGTEPSDATSATTRPVAAATSDPADPSGGLPGWVAPAVIVLLFGAAGTVAVIRRRGTGQGVGGA